MADLTTGQPAVLLELEKFLPYRLEVLSSLVSGALERLYARYNLTVGEWFVLMSLGQGGAMTARTLGDKNQMHKTRVSRILASLLKRGLISRRPDPLDLRAAFIHLTAAGKNTYEECERLATGFCNGLDDALAPADRDALERSLTRLAARSQQLIYDGAGVSPA